MDKRVVLKVDEWNNAREWYVADVHTWTGWRAAANVLDVGEDVERFKQFLIDKYDATVHLYNVEKDFLMFGWPESKYKKAHQFKLDVNRVARKKNYLVERKF